MTPAPYFFKCITALGVIDLQRRESVFQDCCAYEKKDTLSYTLHSLFARLETDCLVAKKLLRNPSWTRAIWEQVLYLVLCLRIRHVLAYVFRAGSVRAAVKRWVWRICTWGSRTGSNVTQCRPAGQEIKPLYVCMKGRAFFVLYSCFSWSKKKKGLQLDDLDKFCYYPLELNWAKLKLFVHFILPLHALLARRHVGSAYIFLWLLSCPLFIYRCYRV